MTHGLTGRSPLLPDEDREEFTAFAAGVLADLAPRGTLEVAFAARVADGMWRLLRIGRIEAACLARELAEAGDRAARLREIPGLPHCAALGDEHVLGAAFIKLDAGGLPNSLARYEAALQRDVERSLKLLQDLRKLRLAAENMALRNKPDSPAAQAGQGFPAERPAGPGEDYAALAAALATPAPRSATTSVTSATDAAGAAGGQTHPAAGTAGSTPGATAARAPMPSEASTTAAPDGFAAHSQQTAGRPGTDATTLDHATAQFKADSPAGHAGQGFPDIQRGGSAGGKAAHAARQAGKTEGEADEPELAWVPFPPDERRSDHHENGLDAARGGRRSEADSPAAQAGQGLPRPRAVRYRQLPPFPACKVGGY